jgi:hypothetical protein
VFEQRERFTHSDDGYRGRLRFCPISIRVFNPVGPEVLREFWPKFSAFSNVKQSLNPAAYRAFERSLVDVRSPLAVAASLEQG